MDGDIAGRALLLVVMVAAGVLLIWAARATASGRIGRNALVGIRLRSTMGSDEAWRAAHRRAERPMILAGVIAIASGLCALLPLPTTGVAVAILAGCVLMLAVVIHAGRAGARAARAVAPAGER
ncbi:hypothetical protein BF93_14975 [Brachybacterium phenoliresistens]|uniref:SdpI/YhfL protein family n=1 Tax=Brachybacterium phenoliresistens TaxID=396014 RepID=Z9JTV1_9MICO|nr:SdpI family protein [Brachybacterium phenoliresistens]EWS81810.1 hypothetical protein BF93_14975 [Brachybacterium phenoliresistens]